LLKTGIVHVKGPEMQNTKKMKKEKKGKLLWRRQVAQRVRLIIAKLMQEVY
jgi:hypothetical protein